MKYELIDFDLLKEYANLQRGELGEAIYELIEFMPCVQYLSDTFAQAYINEIKYQLQWFKDNTKIVETEYELPPKKVFEFVREEKQFGTKKELVYLDE